MAVCNFPKGDLYSHESILEQKLRQKGVLNDDEYSSQDLDWFLICTLAKKKKHFSAKTTLYERCSGERDDSITIYKETDQNEPHTACPTNISLC